MIGVMLDSCLDLRWSYVSILWLCRCCLFLVGLILGLVGVGPVLIRWSIFHITYNVYKTRKLGKSSHGYCLSWLCVLGPKSNLMILFQPRCGRSKGPLSQPVDSSPWTSFWSWFAVHKAMCVFLDSTFGGFNLFALSFILSSGVADILLARRTAATDLLLSEQICCKILTSPGTKHQPE